MYVKHNGFVLNSETLTELVNCVLESPGKVEWSHFLTEIKIKNFITICLLLMMFAHIQSCGSSGVSFVMF